MGGHVAQLLLAAPLARGGFTHHAGERPLAGGRLDRLARGLERDRVATGDPVAAHPVLALPDAARAGGSGRALLPPLRPQPDAAGALFARDDERRARRLAAAASGDRAHLRQSLHGSPITLAEAERAQAGRAVESPDIARWGTHQDRKSVV